MQPRRTGSPVLENSLMLEIDGLTKRYGQHTVVDNLSFRCAAGEVLGFLGPNGAGKSTTMKMITGFVTPDSGNAAICGHSINDDPLNARRQVGYLPEGAPCYPEMTPRSFLNFIADVRELSGDKRRSRLDEVTERLNLQAVLDQSIDTLSKGFKRRVGLAQAILHDPNVLILDEPTDGLDPNQKHEVRELILSMSTDKLIVISTHILEEVEAVCSRAIIIANGRILADDTPGALAARSRYNNAVRLTLADDQHFEEIRAAIDGLELVATTESDRAERSIIAIPQDKAVNSELWRAIADLLAARHWTVSSLQLEGGRLDEVFRQITTGTKS